jgi:hypothetical protein
MLVIGIVWRLGMPLRESVNDDAAGRHTHDPGPLADERQCPYCGQPISRKQYREIRARIEAEERTRIANLEQTLRDRFASEQQEAAEKAKAEIDKAKKDAATRLETAKREAAAREAVIRQQATKVATAALAPKITEAVNAEKQRSYAEKLKLTEQLEDMKRRLEKRTAGDLGNEAEVDLFEALKREFPGDQVTRVPKGQNGPDIIHRVVHNGTVCGTIIYDCKNHRRWLNSFTAKLRKMPRGQSMPFWSPRSSQPVYSNGC